MTRKHYTPEQIIGKLREAEVALTAMIRQLSAGHKPSISRPYRIFLTLLLHFYPFSNLSSCKLGHLKSSSPQLARIGNLMSETEASLTDRYRHLIFPDKTQTELLV